MKNIIYVLLLFIVNINILVSQNDTINIDVDLPGFGDKTEIDKKDTLKPLSLPISYEFLKSVTSLIKAGKTTYVGVNINNKLWIPKSIVEQIDNLDSGYKVRIKNLKTQNSYSKKVSIFTKPKSRLSYFIDSKLDDYISLSDERNIKSAILVLFYVNKNDDPFEKDNIKMEAIHEEINWKDGKGELGTKPITKDRQIIGGILIKRYSIFNCKEFECNTIISSSRKKWWRKTKTKTKTKSSKVFPSGVFQYKSCGILIYKNNKYIIVNIPKNTNGFKSNN